MNDVTLQQLRMLREVASRSTISSAAEALGYTPSAVSQQLAGLERSLGVPVLERVGRNVRLTDAGRELVRHADGLLAGLEAAQAAIEQVNELVAGDIEFAVYETVAGTLLPPLLQRLRADHPDLRVRTRKLDPDVSINALNSGQIDLAFSISYPHAPVPPREGITRFPIMRDAFYLAVPSDDPTPSRPVSLIEFADRDFIAAPDDISCGRCFLSACTTEGFTPRIAHVIEEYATTLRLVAAGEGVSLVSDLGMINDCSGVRLLTLESGLSRTIDLVCRTTSANRPAIVAIRDAALDVVSCSDWKATPTTR